MSGVCGNCDCADKTQCPKKSNSYTFDVVQTEKSNESVFMDAPTGENDNKCKNGSSSTCTNCTCGAR